MNTIFSESPVSETLHHSAPPQPDEVNQEPAKKSPDVAPIQYMRGIGPRRAEALASAGILLPGDALRYYPRSYIDRESVPSLRDLRNALVNAEQQDAFSDQNIRLQNEITIVAFVRAVRERTFGKNRTMVVVELDDNSGVIAEIVFWNQADYFKRIYEPDQMLSVSGVPDYAYGKIQFAHPEINKIDPDDAALYGEGRILPKYRLTQKMKEAGLTMRVLRNVVASIIEQELPKLQETLSEKLLAKYDFPPLRQAARQLHFPDSHAALAKARERMKYEELFYFEMLLAMRHRGTKTLDTAPPVQEKSPTARAMLEQLPFDLTKAQKRVLREIMNDMHRVEPMNRLLQGDVGSGKTVVALLSMLAAIDSGYQCALMAPTEILAEQHYNTISDYCAKLNDVRTAANQVPICVVQLVGGQKKKQRAEIGEKISSGTAHIVVGTHALFQSTTEYKNLAFVVIDEQHRFGVMQRAELKKKATVSFEQLQTIPPTNNPTKDIAPHVLVMSATPIPRTLSMTLYGDLDVSVIDELPKNRKPIKTKVVFESKMPLVWNFIKEQVEKGRQAYVVYPLVEKSEKVEAKSAVEHYEYLQREVFPDLKLGLLHGQMFWYEKEDAMKAFKNKEFHILVATTVVEVGIDVPNASVMLIENAERFGLAQLHQLRGRVGRGTEQSFCLLATKDHFKFHLNKRETQGGAKGGSKNGSNGKTKAENDANERKSSIIRLKTMQETTDGFKIAEVDLKLRGPGDFMGTRQSGVPEFAFADLTTDGETIAIARNDAFTLVAEDPHLLHPENATIRREFMRQHQKDYTLLDVA
jgi:ATP-dependent DNA helicase RecG